MAMEDLIPIWITSSASAVGVIYAIVRNGSRAKKKDDELKSELKSDIAQIKKTLDDPDNGLTAIKKSTEEMRINCAITSTKIEAKANVNAQEIAALRKKR